jgi:tRNA uridine 5-carbamoylmethylation protein Kti12
MIIKITYPFKENINSIEIKNIFLQTNDKEFIKKITSTTNPIEIGLILSENKEKYKIISPQKEDLHIDIPDVISIPELREKFNF